MAKKPTITTLADIVNSPEYKGMNDSVKAQIEKALTESKAKNKSGKPLPRTSKTSISTEEVLANPAMVKAIKEKIGDEATEEFLKKVDEKSKIDDTDKIVVVDRQNKVRKTRQKTKKQQLLDQKQDLQFSLKDFILKKGSRAFNRMFPLLGALMGGVYRGDKNKSNNKNIQTNTQQTNTSGVTAILSSIVNSQKTTNNILTEILGSIKGTQNSNLIPANNANANANTNANTDTEIVNGFRNFLKLLGVATAGVGLGVAGAAGISALSNTRSDQQSGTASTPVSPPTQQPTPAPASAPTQPTPPATPPASAPTQPTQPASSPAQSPPASQPAQKSTPASSPAQSTPASQPAQKSTPTSPPTSAAPEVSRLINLNVNNSNPEPTPIRINPTIANESRVRLAGTTAAQLMGRNEPPARRINSDTERAFNSIPPAQRGLISPNVNNWNPEPVPMRMGAAGRTFAGEENQLTQQQVSPTIQLIRPIETYVRSLNELDASEEASNNEGIPIPHNNLARRNALENGFIQSLSALNNVSVAERPSPPEGTFERLRLIRQRQGAPELPPEPGPRGTVFSGEQDNRSSPMVSASSVGTYSPEPVPSETTIPDIHQAQRARIELAGTTAAQLMGRNEPPARRINSDTERAFNTITPASRNPTRRSDPLNWQGGRPMRSWTGEETSMNAEPSQSQSAPPVLYTRPVNTGETLSNVSTQNAIAERVMPTPPAPPPATSVDTSTTSAPRTQSSSNPIDPNNPGPLEPSDAGLRYARLFSMAA
jgi:hypothetical protein